MKRWRKLTFTTAALALLAGGAALTHRLADDSFVPPPPITDELPDGAVARIGDGRFRPRWGNVGFTADGKGLVAGAPDGVVRVFDVVTGREVRRFEVHTDSPEPGGAAAAKSIGLIDRLMFWRRAPAKPRRPDSILGLAVSPDGRLVATCGLHTFRITDLATGERVADWPYDAQRGMNLLWTSDGRTGVIVGDFIARWSLDPPSGPTAPAPNIQCYDSAEYEGLTSADVVPVPHLVGDSCTVTSDGTDLYDVASGRIREAGWDRPEFRRIVAIAPGDIYATIQRWGGEVELLDGTFRTTSGFAAPRNCRLLCASPTLRKLVLGDAGSAVVVDLSGAVVGKVPVTNAHQAVLSSDGRLAAIVGDSVLVVDTATWSPVADAPPALDARDFGVRDDDTIVVRSAASVVAIEARTGTRRTRMIPCRARPPEFAFEPRGRGLSTPRCFAELESGQETETDADWPDDVGWAGGQILTWSKGRRVARAVAGSSGPRQNVSFSADGTSVAWLDQDAVTIEPTADDSSPVTLGRGIAACRMALSGDGSVVAATYDGDDLRVMRRSDGKDVSRFGVADRFLPIALSLDGARVAVLRADTRTIELRDATTGAVVATFEGHAAAVTAMHFSADGRLLVSGSADDGTILVWDVEAALR